MKSIFVLCTIVSMSILGSCGQHGTTISRGYTPPPRPPFELDEALKEVSQKTAQPVTNQTAPTTTESKTEASLTTLADFASLSNGSEPPKTFSIAVKKGMKWVYQRKTLVPEGANSPFLRASENIGDTTIEIMDTTSDTITLKYMIENKDTMVPTETFNYTVKKDLFLTAYLRPAMGSILKKPGEGVDKVTYAWKSMDQSENISVFSKSYQTKLLGAGGTIFLTSRSGNLLKMVTEEKFWVNSTEGLIRHEISGEMSDPNLSSKILTNVMELKSFTP